MKRLPLLLLLVSLAVNAYYLSHHVRGTRSSAFGKSPISPTQINATNPAPVFSEETWTLLKSGDAASLARLHALGFSDPVVSALVRAEANKRYASRIEALRSPSPGYWQRGFSPQRGGPVKDRATLVDLTREKEAEVKKLLGTAYRPDTAQLAAPPHFLSADKAEQLRLLNEDYSVMQSTRAGYSMLTLPEDRERRRFLDEQRRADIVALLTPEELHSYDQRLSPTANFLRYNLSGFDATEQEFQTLYALSKPLEALTHKTTFDGATDSAQNKIRNETAAAINAQIKTALGEKRYADYQRSQDNDYRTLNSLVACLALPKEKALEGYQLKIALEQKAQAFQPQPGTDEKQQRATFNAALLREAETGFTALYGEKGFQAIRDRLTRVQSGAR